MVGACNINNEQDNIEYIMSLMSDIKTSKFNYNQLWYSIMVGSTVPIVRGFSYSYRVQTIFNLVGDCNLFISLILL